MNFIKMQYNKLIQKREKKELNKYRNSKLTVNN